MVMKLYSSLLCISWPAWGGYRVQELQSRHAIVYRQTDGLHINNYYTLSLNITLLIIVYQHKSIYDNNIIVQVVYLTKTIDCFLKSTKYTPTISIIFFARNMIFSNVLHNYAPSIIGCIMPNVDLFSKERITNRSMKTQRSVNKASIQTIYTYECPQKA